jgi:FkbM family methyltransferase
MNDFHVPPKRSTDVRDPHGTRINLLGEGALNAAKARVLSALGRSRLGWRLNFSVTGTYQGRQLKVPLVFGRGFQNLHIGEPWLLRTIAQTLSRRRGTFIDVGVNLGQTLIKVKLVDVDRSYIGFEPNPICCQYTTELISINQFPDSTLVPVGLSDSAGVATLWAKQDAVDPSASVVPGFRAAGRYARATSVAVFRGDDLLSHVAEVAMIKIDVEGGELEAISGLLETLARCSPIVFCEILPVFDESTENGQFRKSRQDELLTKLQGLGYTVFRMMQDETVVELAAIETHANLALINYAFVAPGDVDAFRRLFKVTKQSVAV